MNVQGPGPRVSSFFGNLGREAISAVGTVVTDHVRTAAHTSGLIDSFSPASSNTQIAKTLAAAPQHQSLDSFSGLNSLSRNLIAAASQNRTLAS